MKLRNKKTGEIVEDTDILAILACAKNDIPIYCSLAELNEEWEDYTPQEPLIKDEKVRKAVRAWADANGWSDAARLQFIDFNYHHSWSLEQSQEHDEIHFSSRMPSELKHHKSYTITELCGEEE